MKNTHLASFSMNTWREQEQWGICGQHALVDDQANTCTP